MKKIGLLFVTIIMLMLFAVSASAATEGYYTYEVENGEATITRVDQSISGDVTIPSTLGGYSVTSIGEQAFGVCSSLTSITIPDSITSIGDMAFVSCKSLTSITIPDSVTSIGYSAFYYCTSLTSITIPDSVTSIGHSAFYHCESLTSITIPEGVTSIGYCAFSDCTSLTSITIPDSVTSIGDNAFEYCTSLTSLTLPDNVTTIGEHAFRHCDSLTSIIIPDSVTSIGNGAFVRCKNLTSITLSNSITTLANSIFCDCENLTSIAIPESVTTIIIDAFFECTSLTNITVDENNKYYSSDSNGVLFNKDKTKLVICPAGKTETIYIIPDSVISIGDFAFVYCSNFTSIIIPDSVTSIGGYAFAYCTSLTNITIPDSVATIGFGAFGACSNLTSITISDSVTAIGDMAFYECSNLTDIYYNGTEEQWKAVDIGIENNDLLNATIHYHTHSFTNYISDGTATCITDGKLIAKCDNCNATDSVIEKGTHKFSESFTIDVDPTCTNVGEKSRHCLYCSEITDKTSVDKIAHNYNIITINPSCTDRGHKIYTCNCGDNFDESIPAKGHSFNGSACTDCGYNRANDCSCNCHKTGLFAIIWKIINIFNKLLKKNPSCSCGAAHY